MHKRKIMETTIEYIWLKGDEPFANIGKMVSKDPVSITKLIFEHLFVKEIAADDTDEAGKYLGEIFEEYDIKPSQFARDVFKVKTESAALTRDINKKLGTQIAFLKIIDIIDDCPNCGREREYFEDAEFGGEAYSMRRCKHCKEDWKGDIEDGPVGLYGKFY